ncbi:MAG: phenylacetic acid degradation protein [Glaciihabitans sp.]|nr:phenylacetic acid degradation protein [Glaciihabitans sp.]
MRATDTQATRRRAVFHSLTVSEVRRLTSDAIEVSFAIPDELRDDYSYAPGQYIAIRTDAPGEDVRRSYSICQAPVAGELKVAIKRDLGGVFSTWALENLEVGMALEVMSPEGSFTSRLVLDTAAHYVAIAAGSGIAPVLALIESTLGANPDNRFSLVYSNRTAMDTMFIDELADLKDRYPTRLALYHLLTREHRSSELLSGRLDAKKFRDILDRLIPPGDVDEWFICGPFDLVQLCRDILEEFGVERAAIRYELFTTDRPDRPKGQTGRPIEGGADGSDQAVHTISFRLDGTMGTVTSPVHSNESILNAALRVRGDVPFACAGGVCGTCRAVLIRGTVDMEENYALEPEELERGYVLTCQSIPTSDLVEVNYDA